MNLSLFISFAIILAGLLGALYFARINTGLDNMLAGLGKLTRDILKYSLFGLFALLFFAAIYSIFVWATTGNQTTIGQSLGAFTQDLERGADYTGNLINGDSNSAPGVGTSAIAKPSSVLTPTGSMYQSANPVIYDLAMNPVTAGSATLLDYESHRGLKHDFTIGSDCSRFIKDSGNCFGLSRFFKDDQLINSGCQKIYIRAPQMIRSNNLVTFPL